MAQASPAPSTRAPRGQDLPGHGLSSPERREAAGRGVLEPDGADGAANQARPGPGAGDGKEDHPLDAETLIARSNQPQ